MKVVICSVPKSGTYLLSNFLEELELKNSKFHLNDNEYSDYSSSTIERARKEPEFFKRELELKEVIKKIGKYEFAVGHFSTYNRKYLRDFKIIFLHRNLRDCTVSFAIWTRMTNRWSNQEKNNEWRKTIKSKEFVYNFLQVHGDNVYGLFRKTVPWVKERNILKIKFESLTGESGREMQIEEFKRIVSYLGYNLEDREIETKISNALNRKSLTKITSKENYSFYFSSKFENLYKKKGFRRLNNTLGYDGLAYRFKNKISFKPSMTYYDLYWKRNKKKIKGWIYGINIVDNLINNYKFETILDAGCGSGDVVRYLNSHGYKAQGIELSESVLKEHARDLLRTGNVQKGTLTNLPYKDNSFDVVFSSEVLEHIKEESIPSVISELFRVSKSLIFVTISLRPSSNFNKYHITLKSRQWWEKLFLKFPLEKDVEMIRKIQSYKRGVGLREILELGPTKTHIHEMEWFIEKPPYDLQGELEPWYFIFKKNV